MKRWRTSDWKDGKEIKAGHEVERPDIDAFLDDVITTCKRHGFGLSHEDGHGGFEIVDVAAFDTDWLRVASDLTSKMPPEPAPSSESTPLGIEQAFDTLEAQLAEVRLTSPDFYNEAFELKERLLTDTVGSSREHIVVAALMLQRDMAKEQMESEAK